jgi:hypothetical protein
MSDAAETSTHHASPELAELVHRTLAAKRAQQRAEHASPAPSWAISIRFRLGGFRPRALAHR